MRTITCHLDAVNGLHFPFQRECEGVREYLGDHDEITVGSPTQLLALDVICEREGYHLDVHLPDGRVATNEGNGLCPAHEYVNREYIFLDTFGLDLEDDPQ